MKRYYVESISASDGHLYKVFSDKDEALAFALAASMTRRYGTAVRIVGTDGVVAKFYSQRKAA